MFDTLSMTFGSMEVPLREKSHQYDPTALARILAITSPDTREVEGQLAPGAG